MLGKKQSWLKRAVTELWLRLRNAVAYEFHQHGRTLPTALNSSSMHICTSTTHHGYISERVLPTLWKHGRSSSINFDELPVRGELNV